MNKKENNMTHLVQLDDLICDDFEVLDELAQVALNLTYEIFLSQCLTDEEGLLDLQKKEIILDEKILK
jgi:hypothetical protein